MQINFQKPTSKPKKNKRKSSKTSDENANSTLEYGYDTQQDELEVKQQFSRYVDQDVYFN